LTHAISFNRVRFAWGYLFGMRFSGGWRVARWRITGWRLAACRRRFGHCWLGRRRFRLLYYFSLDFLLGFFFTAHISLPSCAATN
jgi:hypothetical protein